MTDSTWTLVSQKEEVPLVLSRHVAAGLPHFPTTVCDMIAGYALFDGRVYIRTVTHRPVKVSAMSELHDLRKNYFDSRIVHYFATELGMYDRFSNLWYPLYTKAFSAVDPDRTFQSEICSRRADASLAMYTSTLSADGTMLNYLPLAMRLQTVSISRHSLFPPNVVNGILVRTTPSLLLDSSAGETQIAPLQVEDSLNFCALLSVTGDTHHPFWAYGSSEQWAGDPSVHFYKYNCLSSEWGKVSGLTLEHDNDTSAVYACGPYVARIAECKKETDEDGMLQCFWTSSISVADTRLECPVWKSLIPSTSCLGRASSWDVRPLPCLSHRVCGGGILAFRHEFADGKQGNESAPLAARVLVFDCDIKLTADRKYAFGCDETGKARHGVLSFDECLQRLEVVLAPELGVLSSVVIAFPLEDLLSSCESVLPAIPSFSYLLPDGLVGSRRPGLVPL